MQMKSCLRTAFLKTLPVMAGYMVLGFGFGIITVEAGYGFFYCASDEHSDVYRLYAVSDGESVIGRRIHYFLRRPDAHDIHFF